jgi:hypothetical protein
MKFFLFQAVATSTGLILSINLAVGNAVTSIVVSFFNIISTVVKFIAERLMLIIDADRYKYASLATKQSAELMELNLLMAANKVKEDAIATKTWTMDHTIALNKIGTALYVSCNWEPAKVHKYFRPLVESISGMSYMAGDDFEEE